MRDFLKVLGLGTIGIIAAAVYLLFLCTGEWCTSFSLSKIHEARDFASCRSLGFAVTAMHPPECRAGTKVFFADDSPLRLMEPIDSAAAGLPLRIVGEVRSQSGSLQYRLEDQDGFTLVSDTIPYASAGSGQYALFTTNVYYPKPLGTGGTLRVFAISAQGREQEAITVPLSFVPTASVEVKAFFGNTERDPMSLVCGVAYPVARRVPESEDLLHAALRELLHGPTLLEQRQKFFTSIPPNVDIRSVKIAEGRVSVDFSSALSRGVAGSCRVAAIRSQIERTLKQFSSVEEVVISVEGETEEALQP